MSSKSNPTIKKPKLSRERLEKHGVVFNEKVHDGDDLPIWLRDIRGRLICLRRKPPINRKDEFEREYREFRDSGHDSEKAFNEGWSLKPLDTDAESMYYHCIGEDTYAQNQNQEITKCGEISKSARTMLKKGEMESAWMVFLQTFFFKKFNDIHTEPNAREDTLERWELEENVHWNEFPRDKNMNPEVPGWRTGPKPDLTYAFPIIDTLTKANLGDYVSLLRDSKVKYFSRRILTKLRTDTHLPVRSAPTTSLHTLAKCESQELGPHGSICFPWAVVEAKKNKVIPPPDAKHRRENKAMEKFCYCQAANAAARALELREKLFAGAKTTTDDVGDYGPRYHTRLGEIALRNSQVIFSFTCVGPSVKLWVTYRGKPGEGSSGCEQILMACIWGTSLELTWGALRLRMVIKNMKEWVYEEVKPVIAQQVERIYKHPQRSTSTAEWDSIPRASRAESCAPQTSQYDYPRPKTPPLHRLITEPESVDRGRSRIPTIQLNNDEDDFSDESWNSDRTCVNQIEEAKVNRSRSISDTELRNLTPTKETKTLIAISPGEILTRSRRRSQLSSKADGEAEEERGVVGNTRHAEKQYQIPLRPKPTTKTALKLTSRSRDRSKTKSDGESESELERESSTARRASLRRRSSRF